MGFDYNYTKYTPNINVGVSRLILGETTVQSKSVIKGLDLIKIEQGTHPFYFGDIKYDHYYPKEYDKSIFRSSPTLTFDTPDNSLTSISSIISYNYKCAVIEKLTKKYGENRNTEWKAKGVYRTEINNTYGIIQIDLFEFDRQEEADNLYGFKPPILIKELNLNMYITKLKTTKLQMDKALQSQNSKLQLENGIGDADLKMKSAVNKLFDID